MESSSKVLLRHIPTFANSKTFNMPDPTGHKQRGTYFYFVFFRNLAGPKQLASPSVFKDFVGGGILINCGNRKIRTHFKI